MPRNISVFFLSNRFLLITCSGLATAKYQILQRIKIPTKLNRFPTSIVVVVSKVLETNNHVVQVYLSSIFYEFQQQFNLVSINEWLSTALIKWPYDAAPYPCCFHQFLSSCFQFKNVYFRIVLSRLDCVNSVPVIDVFSDLLWFYLNNFILWFFFIECLKCNQRSFKSRWCKSLLANDSVFNNLNYTFLFVYLKMNR